MNNQLGERVAAVLALACILVAPYIHPAWAFALLVIVLALVLLLVEKTTFFSVSIIALAIFYGIGLIPLFIFSCTLAFVVIGESGIPVGWGECPGIFRVYCSRSAVSRSHHLVSQRNRSSSCDIRPDRRSPVESHTW